MTDSYQAGKDIAHLEMRIAILEQKINGYEQSQGDQDIGNRETAQND